VLLAVRKLVGVGDHGVPVGEDHPHAKLTDREVNKIRDLHEHYGFSYNEIAAMFNVPKPTIAAICTYRRRATSAVDWRPARDK
jgi:hypothetical protein